METSEKLDKLREPFPANLISKLPKPTKEQTEEVRSNFKKGIRCEVCGGWHHPKVIHLDYVGHAALTDRLLDTDPEWNWEPLAFDECGLPKYSKDGLWIKLTVCGVTRLGFGDAQGKTGPNAIKEMIGDALRNAAMRFGAALDLWHKGDLHDSTEDTDDKPKAKHKIVNHEKQRKHSVGEMPDFIPPSASASALKDYIQSLSHYDDHDVALEWMKDCKAEFERTLDDTDMQKWRNYCAAYLKSLKDA